MTRKRKFLEKFKIVLGEIFQDFGSENGASKTSFTCLKL